MRILSRYAAVTMTITTCTNTIAADSLDITTAADGPPLVAPTIIEPSTRWRLINIEELWRARELVGYLAWRDVHVRYKQTALGAAWAVLQPLATMAVFAAVFGRLAVPPSGGMPYPLFALAGLLPWTLFASAVSAAGGSVIGSEHIITKIYFPRLAIPLAAIGVAAVDFAVALVLLAIVAACFGFVPGPGLLLAPAIVASIALAAVGLGTLLAALNVAFRDFKHVIPFLLQLGLFATPAVYLPPRAAPGGWLGALLALNPMNALVSAFRASMLGGPMPWTSFGAASAASVAMFLAGCTYFRRVEDGFADVI
jgi:lipopolysaccharide transport system permease protein